MPGPSKNRDTMKPGRRRICIKLQTPNPLFERWIIEWLKETEQKNTQNQHSLRKALQSIQRYPLALSTGQDCQILDGFGQRICQMIDAKLEKHTREHGAIVETPIERNLKVLQHIQDMLRDEDAENRVELIQKNVKMFPNNFEVLLLVDTQERIGKIKSTNENTLKDLEKYNVKFEVRRLSIGDFLWIARDEQGNELVLPYIVERKRMDDLGSSIRDGRFHEQKFRIKQCRLANVIYLIESYGKNQNVGLPVATLYQAATNTLVQSGFQVKFTENLAHTVMYLSVMTTFVKQLFQDKILTSSSKCADNELSLLEFSNFNRASLKTTKELTAREIFMKQLLQLRFLSVEKAQAITQMFPTPRSLYLAYRKCSSSVVGEKLLSNLQCGPLKRNLGVNISKTLYQLYSNKSVS